MTRPKRSLRREIGNPLTVFHGKSHGRNVKWSSFRVILISCTVLFLFHFPSEWGPWEFATLAVLVLATTIDTLFAMAPISEGLAALTAIFGGAINKRTGGTVTVEEKSEVPTPISVPPPEEER